MAVSIRVYRWYDNETDKPFDRNPLLEQLLSQTYDFMFEKDSGNRVFQMIVNMDIEKRHINFRKKLIKSKKQT